MTRAALVLLLALACAPARACDVPAGLTALRAALLDAANAHRAGAGVAPLTAEPRLDEAAQTQACRIAGRARLSHRGSWLAGLGRRLRRVGYPFAIAVENLARGQSTPAEAIQGWAASPEHRANLLDPRTREAGFGIARGADGQLAWSMVAAARR
ncbi:MAG: hypothetical protein Kow0013_23260 [Pararhodobacter sp.]